MCLCVAEEGLWGGEAGDVELQSFAERNPAAAGWDTPKKDRSVGGCIAEWPVEEEAIDRRKRPNGRLWSGA